MASASAVSRLLRASGLRGMRAEHHRIQGGSWGKHAPSISGTVFVYGNDLDAATELLTARGYSVERSSVFGLPQLIVRR